MTDQTTPEPMADEETLPLAFSDQARRLLAEIDRLTTALDRSHTETRRLGISLAETIHARHQLRTQLADAERTRRAALDVAADLTDERDQARAEAARAWPEGHAAAMAAMLDERDSLTAQLAAVRELARRWQRDAHKRREIADARPGLTQIERAEIRQAATEIEQCARGLHRVLGPDAASHGPATATGAPGPDPSEGTAPTSPQEPTQAAVDTIARILVGTDWDEEVPYTDIGPRETVAHLARRIIAAADLDIGDRLRAERDALAAKLAAVRTIEPTLRRIYSASDGTQAERAETTTAPGGAAPGPAPLTLAQAAGHLHDWARDLTDGTNTSYPHGHPSVIRGIRAAADWLDARSAYETEARDARAARPIGLIGDTDG